MKTFTLLLVLFSMNISANDSVLPPAEVEEVTIEKVAAVCSAMSGVLYNYETGIVSFTPDPFWDQFTTELELQETQLMVAMSTQANPLVIKTWLEGSDKCDALKSEVLTEELLKDEFTADD